MHLLEFSAPIDSPRLTTAAVKILWGIPALAKRDSNICRGAQSLHSDLLHWVAMSAAMPATRCGLFF